ncbi:MAG: 4Fe-4S binding protein [Deltaproteobacteria bacterium]|nr:4Fe-4S binding protein [Deltaproteobacteria bacterium]
MSEPAPRIDPTSPADGETTPAPLTRGRRIDLFRAIPGLGWLAKRRSFQFWVVLPNLFLFLLFLTAGIAGTPVGNRNIIIVFVWILWWFLLISLLVPFVSRIWCTVCPFPFFGEWAQRRALIKVRAVAPKDRKSGPGVVIGRNRYFGLNLKWPKRLSNIWIQNIGFLFLCTFAALFLTRPIVSVVVLGSLFVIATTLHLIYRQRAFCSYVCPVSGFLSLYSMSSTVEVRAKDAGVCDKCKDKGCLAGSEKGWGCPWYVYPSKLDRNNYCGLCMECVKTCPSDNITVNARPFCSDRLLKGWDEAWKAFIMLSLALAYSVTFLGPWGFIKDWANVAEKQDWAGFATYTAILWATALVIVPGIYAAAVGLGRFIVRKVPGAALPFKDVFLGFVYPLVPLGLLTWIAFSLPLILVNGSYIAMVISDPFGFGWDLFGTANMHWTPVVPEWTPYIQVVLLLGGLFFALRVGFAHATRLYRETRVALRAFLPVGCLLGVFVGSLIFLYAA